MKRAAIFLICVASLVLVTASAVLSLETVSLRNATSERYYVEINFGMDNCGRPLAPGAQAQCATTKIVTIHLLARSEDKKGVHCEATPSKAGAYQVVTAGSSCRIEPGSAPPPPTGVLIVENKSDTHVVFGLTATGWSFNGVLPAGKSKEIEWPAHVGHASFHAIRAGNPSCSTAVYGPGTVVMSGALSCSYAKK